MLWIENRVGESSCAGGGALFVVSCGRMTGLVYYSTGREDFIAECCLGGWHMGSTCRCLPISVIAGGFYQKLNRIDE